MTTPNQVRTVEFIVSAGNLISVEVKAPVLDDFVLPLRTFLGRKLSCRFVSLPFDNE